MIIQHPFYLGCFMDMIKSRKWFMIIISRVQMHHLLCSDIQNTVSTRAAGYQWTTTIF